MKDMIKYVLCGAALLFMTACGDMYEIHEKYLKMGEETYIGLVDNLEANSGFNRIELRWTLNADPRISKCVITWDENEPAVEVPISSDRNINDTISTIISLAEGKYIFDVVSMSESGKSSLTQTVSGEVYGSNYQEGLNVQAISSMEASLAGVTINWIQTEGCTGTELIYTNADGVVKTVSVTPEDESTLLPDAVLGTSFSLVSKYKESDEMIDEIPTLAKEIDFPTYYVVSSEEWSTVSDQYIEADRSSWTITASTEETVGEGTSGFAYCVLDGDLSSFWHSQWRGDGAYPPLPHELVIDMQQTTDILSIELARRQNNKDTKNITFSISADGTNWTELGELKFPNDVAPNAKILLLPRAVQGRYLRAVVTASNNSVNASISEIKCTTGKR